MNLVSDTIDMSFFPNCDNAMERIINLSDGYILCRKATLDFTRVHFLFPVYYVLPSLPNLVYDIYTIRRLKDLSFQTPFTQRGLCVSI